MNKLDILRSADTSDFLSIKVFNALQLVENAMISNAHLNRYMSYFNFILMLKNFNFSFNFILMFKNREYILFI